MNNTGRRRFLGLCLGGVAAAAAAGAVYPVMRYLAPGAGDESAAKVVIPEKELTDGEAKFFEYAGAAAVLVRTGHGIVALSAVCTHLGCIVQWRKDSNDFLCPCHGGRYDSDGNVIAGPPPKRLMKLPVQVADGTITVG